MHTNIADTLNEFNYEAFQKKYSGENEAIENMYHAVW